MELSRGKSHYIARSKSLFTEEVTSCGGGWRASRTQRGAAWYSQIRQKRLTKVPQSWSLSLFIRENCLSCPYLGNAFHLICHIGSCCFMFIAFWDLLLQFVLLTNLNKNHQIFHQSLHRNFSFRNSYELNLDKNLRKFFSSARSSKKCAKSISWANSSMKMKQNLFLITNQNHWVPFK